MPSAGDVCTSKSGFYFPTLYCTLPNNESCERNRSAKLKVLTLSYKLIDEYSLVGGVAGDRNIGNYSNAISKIYQARNE